ncbi:DinB family protein [Winogradskyella aurantiaca]|uniref:DinB family protein n=1 Tax=Winogradskyella aurantiaca TaxID=2219558 RepID=UPI000E1CF7CA|nr:DinB family protein [Winogradskyella aurantiaca]
MVTEHLTRLFSRDLDKLIAELNSYQNESHLWLLDKDISNTAGNLSLHLVGNLNHFIGASIGNSGYVRQRDLEFSQKNIPREEIIKSIEATKLMIAEVLTAVTEEELNQEFRRNPFEDYMSTEFFLLHLLTHLSYHLGQINYHRRLLDV